MSGLGGPKPGTGSDSLHTVRIRLTIAFSFLLVLSACGVSREVAEPSDSVETTGTSEAVVATTVAPGSSDVAATVVFGDGTTSELLHGDVNDIVGPTSSNLDFVALVFQGTPPPNFDTTVLSQTILRQIIDNELATLDVETSPENLEQAKGLLLSQLQAALIGSADPQAEFDRLYGEVPYLRFFAELQARQIALSDRLALDAAPGEGLPCVRHILVDTEEEGETLMTDLGAGADFSALAVERSVGPSGPDGGELGCVAASGFVPEFEAAVNEAEIGVPIGPVQTQYGWHVLIVDSLQVDGDQMARDRLTAGLTSATITVDDRLGHWDSNQLAVVPVGS